MKERSALRLSVIGYELSVRLTSVLGPLSSLFVACFLLLGIFATQLHAQVSSGGGGIYAPGGIPAKPKPKPKPTPTPRPDGETDWKNTGGTDWNTGTNWTAVSGSAPPAAGDVAWFKTAFSSGQPNLSASVSIAGLYFNGTGTSGYDITSSSTAVKLTLTGTASAIGIETGNTTAVAIGAENTGGTNTISAPIVLAPVSGSTSTIYQAIGGTLVINGAISGSGITLDKEGAGTLTLAGANTFTGGVTINAGTVRAGSTTALGPAANATLTFSNNSTGKFQLNGFDTTIVSLFTAGGTGAIIENGSTTTNATLTDNTSGSDAFAGILQDGAAGTLSLTKSGAGILLLQNVNTYTGDTTINAGTLEFLVGTPGIGGSSNNSTIRLGSTAANSAAATLSLGDDASGNTLTSPLIVQASVSGTQGTRLLLSLATIGHTNTYGGNITLNADLTMQSAMGGTLFINGTSKTVDLGNHILTIDDNSGNVNTQGNVTIVDQITGTGGSIVKNGAGTLILQNTNNT
jgi:fibronectin-binding autotransporter adhesin